MMKQQPKLLQKLFSNIFVIKHRRLLVVLADILTFVGISFAVYIYLQLSHDISCTALVFTHNVGVLAVFTIAMHIIFGTYNSLWRYAEAKEYMNVLLGSIIGFLLFIGFSIPLCWQYAMPFATMGVATCYVIAILGTRFCYRIYRRAFSKVGGNNVINESKKRIAIIGAGDAGVSLMEELITSDRSPFEVWGFIDDDLEKIGKVIHGIEVKCSIDTMGGYLVRDGITNVIMAIPSLPVERRQDIVKICSSLHIKLSILPDTMLVMENRNFANSVRDVKVEDLLGRTVVNLDQSEIKPFIANKTIVVTGGGGSIGSELCRQIASHKPNKLIIFDIFENNAYDLKNELKRIVKDDDIEVEIEIGSVRDKKRIELLFEKYHPDVVFHAAAHKHVPLMEHNPAEAVKNNIFGTYNFMSTAVEYQCPKFIMISTDKAVNPTSVMGATKRYCEFITFALSKRANCKTEFVSVRFGNVLASSGSVIPLFQRQIELGGPVTITDKRMTRYFMTIPEAASLVLTAGAMAKQTEIYVLSMGTPMKILDLAENLIRLSGYEPYTDIEIKEIGMRPGEKLYEEPLIQSDIHYKTASDRIYVEKQPSDSETRDIEKDFELLRAAIETGDDNEVVKALKTVVPEFAKDNAKEKEPESYYTQNK